ncbi:hypothetical protein F4861DRAFT_378237 [Xylaria intraflava]|nr:hypothetical protein F4861DRAFT_378237 [Xylaria intraflava]
MMNNLSRHIACKLCRDRKVRCDGGQPSCEKCRRSGETCVYVPTHKPTKADLAQTIESLQERLDKAEAYILRQGNTNIPTAASSLPLAVPNSALSVEYSGPSSFDLHMSTTAPVPTGHFPSAVVHGLPSTSYSHQTSIPPETPENEFINYVPSTHMSVPNDPVPFARNPVEDPRRMDDRAGISMMSPSARRDSVYLHRRMPSLREVRIVNGSSASTPSSSSSSSSSNGRGHRPDDANHILAEFTAFGMAVFNTQAEIAGISSVVAEYLEWIRRAPDTSEHGDGQQAALKANMVVLEALETRVRELNAMACTKHLEAWRQSVYRLERIPGVGAMLNLFDNEMLRRSGETAKFFQTGYDISLPLAEQTVRKD